MLFHGYHVQLNQCITDNQRFQCQRPERMPATFRSAKQEAPRRTRRGREGGEDDEQTRRTSLARPAELGSTPWSSRWLQSRLQR